MDIYPYLYLFLTQCSDVQIPSYSGTAYINSGVVPGGHLGCEEVKGGSRALVTAILFLETLFLSFSWNFVYWSLLVSFSDFISC